MAQTLGANLGLELRAWTQAADDWTQVRSEIVLAVNAALDPGKYRAGLIAPPLAG